MSTSSSLHGIAIKRISEPSDDEIEAIVQAMAEGFANEPFSKHFPPSPSVDLSHYNRVQYMSYVGPGLIGGEVWVASVGDAILGVAVWSTAKRTLTDSPEQRRYKDAAGALISPECRRWQDQVKSKVIEERETTFPRLWRDPYHLHMLVTVPSARGRGVGGALVNEMIKQARAEGAGMSLATHSEPNRNFYQRLGFRTHWERELVYPDGSKEPYIVMTLEVEP